MADRGSLGRSAGRSVAFSATAAAGSNLDKNSSGAAVSCDCSGGTACGGRRISAASDPDGCQLFRKRSLLRKLTEREGERDPDCANSVRSNFVQTLRISLSVSVISRGLVATVMTEREMGSPAGRASERQSQIHFAVFGPRRRERERERPKRKEGSRSLRSFLCVLSELEFMQN